MFVDSPRPLRADRNVELSPVRETLYPVFREKNWRTQSFFPVCCFLIAFSSKIIFMSKKHIWDEIIWVPSEGPCGQTRRQELCTQRQHLRARRKSTAYTTRREGECSRHGDRALGWAVLRPMCEFSTSCHNILNVLSMVISLIFISPSMPKHSCSCWRWWNPGQWLASSCKLGQRISVEGTLSWPQQSAPRKNSSFLFKVSFLAVFRWVLSCLHYQVSFIISC